MVRPAKKIRFPERNNNIVYFPIKEPENLVEMRVTDDNDNFKKGEVLRFAPIKPKTFERKFYLYKYEGEYYVGSLCLDCYSRGGNVRIYMSETDSILLNTADFEVVGALHSYGKKINQ